MTDMTATQTPTVVDGVDLDELITHDVLTEYRQRGYWVSPKLFSAEQIAAMREAQERMWAGEHDSEIPSQYGARAVEPGAPDVRQQCNAFWLSDVIRKVTTSPLLGAIGARFMGVDTVRLWHDQAVYKPGIGPDDKDETAGNIGWHQDYGHWKSSSTSNMCTAWIALQDTDLQNGGMRTIVGSHKWGLLEDSDNLRAQGPGRPAGPLCQPGHQRRMAGRTLHHAGGPSELPSRAHAARLRPQPDLGAAHVPDLPYDARGHDLSARPPVSSQPGLPRPARAGGRAVRRAVLAADVAQRRGVSEGE